MKLKVSIREAKGQACPAPTQNLELNTENRDAAIESDHIQYGPLNLNDEEYWVRLAEHWNTTLEVAKESNCSNCAAFDISPRMEECMPGSLQEDGRLGYCWMHHFKCHSARTCYTWAAGGPIAENQVSEDWQEKNKDSIEEKKKKKKDDRCTRIAKRKYDVWPSAYASGAVVKCRQGKIWKGLKEAEFVSMVEEEVAAVIDEKKKKKAGTESSKESSLRDWFGRKGAKGKSSGWVDCNTCRKDKKTGRKTCKSCGREKGEKRSKYPACRPTPGACGESGRGKSWGKKSKKSEALQMHIDEGVGVNRSIYRPGSDGFFALYREARELYREGLYTPVNEEEKDALENSNIGEFAMFEGEKVPLDFPMLNEEIIEEAEYKGKKVSLNKPSRNTGSGKKYKVYVKNPTTGNVKKISYGDSKGGLKGGWNNPESRASFAARHDCKNKKDKTKAGYWACRAHKDFGPGVGRFW